MKKSNWHFLDTSALVLSMTVIAAEARAQEANPPTGGGAQSTNTLEEIIVTATRRSVSIDKVPMSIAALNSEILDKNNTRNAPMGESAVDVDATTGASLRWLLVNIVLPRD